MTQMVDVNVWTKLGYKSLIEDLDILSAQARNIRKLIQDGDKLSILGHDIDAFMRMQMQVRDSIVALGMIEILPDLMDEAREAEQADD